MVDELEQLLNSLVEKGYEPFREKAKSVEYLFEGNQFYFKNIPGGMVGAFYCTIRELVSKESGLWQFVCENGYNQYRKEYWEGYTKYNMKAEYWDEGDYEYYLIESALCDENKLEDFLLSNIKVYE